MNKASTTKNTRRKEIKRLVREKKGQTLSSCTSQGVPTTDSEYDAFLRYQAAKSASVASVAQTGNASTCTLNQTPPEQQNHLVLLLRGSLV